MKVPQVLAIAIPFNPINFNSFQVQILIRAILGIKPNIGPITNSMNNLSIILKDLLDGLLMKVYGEYLSICDQMMISH